MHNKLRIWARFAGADLNQKDLHPTSDKGLLLYMISRFNIHLLEWKMIGTFEI